MRFLCVVECRQVFKYFNEEKVHARTLVGWLIVGHNDWAKAMATKFHISAIRLFLLLGVWVLLFFTFCPLELIDTPIEMGKWVCSGVHVRQQLAQGILIKRNATLSVAYNFHFIYFFFFSRFLLSLFLSLFSVHPFGILLLSIAFISDRRTGRIKRKKIIINK